MSKVCECGKNISNHRKFCSRKCYFASDVFRQGVTKSRPSILGKNNPNYKNKSRQDPIIAQRLKDACKKRGQPWTEKHRKEHSIRMLGDTNKMRGEYHSDETKKILSDIQKNRHSDGKYINTFSKISKAEKEIKIYLGSKGIECITQYWVKGIPYYYDFYLPKYNLIIEYNGDYWHANPKKFKSGEYLNIANRGPVLVDDIWKRDEEKKTAIENLGYRLVYIWESEYKYLGEKSIENTFL